jgi:hypothetical protein
VDNMKTFVLWFLEQLPSFLLSEPMCYFVGFAFLIVTIRIIRDVIRI